MVSTSNDWATEPIAIIGMSCRFAGDATSPEKLWELLAEGRSGWSDIPSSRFKWKGAYNPNYEKRSTTHVRGGHFLEEDLSLFDSVFFNFSSETASTLDPQFRLQLESVYEALENAGLPLPKIAGSNTSVFAGVFWHDYRESMIRDEDDLPRFYATGTGSAMASNRISHFFDLRGASMTLDTGCSTTLVALHQAVQSLRTGEADMSLVGGSNVMLNPDMFKSMASIGLLSPDGKSFAFDSRANGYGRGEGVATIVIKRLKDAVTAGDPIRAIVRETLLNQDGKTDTITTPSQAAQETLIRNCYRKANIDPLDTQYFEAHGTGTPTGDPLEARAIAAVFQPGRSAEEALLIGSVKTNVGHTEPTSGLASIIKVALALENRMIPPSINFEKPNPRLALKDWHLKVATELEEWPTARDGIRRASINNFGYGGSNAHVVMESGDFWLPRVVMRNNTHSADGHPHRKAIPAEVGSGTINGNSAAINAQNPGGTSYINDSTPLLGGYKSKVFILSAKDESACQKMVSNLKKFLEQNKSTNADTFLQSLAYTLGQRRTLFSWVAAHPVPFTCGIDELIHALDSPKFKPSHTSSQPRIGMVFTGQGAQWHAMGRELIIAYPVFRASLEEGSGYLKQLGADWSLMEELFRDAETTRVNETGLSIPVCVALQISLVRLLRTWGVTPTAVTSHSSGEIAAAYTVGAISYKTSMAIAYYRSALAADKSLRGPIKGGMVAIGLGLGATERYLERLTCGGKVTAACINSPSSVTVAGDLSAIQEIETMVIRDGVFARRLRVDTGYHSHHMDPVANPYLKALQGMPIEENCNNDLDSIIFSSPVTGGRMTSAIEIADSDHWVRSLVQPVQFVDAFIDMVLGDFSPSGTSVDVIVEVGPHTALGGPIRQILELPEFTGLQLPYYGCLVRNTNGRDSMQALAASLLREGHPLNIEAVNFPWGKAPHVRVLTNLPSYPWNHQTKHWFEPRFNKAIRDRMYVPHDLLGSLVPGTNLDSPAWRHITRATETPWIMDHVFQSNILYPGAGFICLAIEAVAQMINIESEAMATALMTNAKKTSGYRLRDVDILQALIVPDNGDGIEIQTIIRPVSDKNIGIKGYKQFEICSVTADNGWTQHAKGLILVEFDGSSHSTPIGLDKKSISLSGYTRRVDPSAMFAGLRSVGINHGPLFQNMKSIVQSGKKQRSVSVFAVANTSVPNDLPRNHVIHPTTLDSVIQSSYTTLPGAGSRLDSPFLPRALEKLWVSSRISHSAGHRFKAYSTLGHADAQSFKANVSLVNDDDDDDESHDLSPVLEVQGLVCQSLGRRALPEQAEAWEKEVCSKVKWAPDMTIASSAALESIVKPLRHRIDPNESNTIMDLRRVCVYYIQDALAELSKSDVDQLDAHHVKFYGWMKDQLQFASSGLLGPCSARWMLDSPSERQRRIDFAVKASVNGEMVRRLGPHLAAMLRREMAPLEVMMEDKLLYKYYKNSFKVERSCSQLARLFGHIIHKNPRARILEIGAGTGGATRFILKALGTTELGGPLAASYHFTDISSSFFEAARKEFAPWIDLLAFDTLDIEQNPAAQGFTLGSYDIIIASEVLHATKSIVHTLANVRSLMKPGGKLLLIETTQDQLDLQFVFGLLPGWWLSEDPERTSSPSLNVPLWDQALKAAAFGGVEVSIPDCESDDMYSFSTIMSTVLPTQPSKLASDSILLVVNSKAPPPPSWLELLQSSIAAGGSFPVVQALESVVATASTYSGKVCLFIGEVSQPVLQNLETAALEGIKALVASCKGLIWATRGGSVECEKPEYALASGFLRSLRNEYVGRRLMTLDLDPNTPLWSNKSVSAIIQVLKAGFGHPADGYVVDAPPDEFEYAERDGIVLIPRYYNDMDRNKIVSLDEVDFSTLDTIPNERLHQADRPLCMHVGVPGLLDTLAFSDDPWLTAHGDSLPSDFVEVEPRAYGVNFRDVMVAMGQLNERIMGLECAGVITRVGSRAATHGYAIGNRVFCILRGPFACRARVEWTSTMHMPAGLSFEDAASLPVIFSTAYFSFVNIANLQRGQSVLIHAAAGGVGQAALMLARHLGAEIFATVGTPDKRNLVMQKYGIPADKIFNSRDTSFAADVLAATAGRGVDVVLNSLAGAQLQESFNILAPFGHFVEIGKRDLELNSTLEMQPFSRQASFSSFDLIAMTRHKGREIHHVLAEISRLVENKVLAPVAPVKVYPIAEAAQAFRLLQAGKHTGKVVLSVSPHEMVPVLPRALTARLSPYASYLLVGGMGGIGRSVAKWMVAKGAKNIILLSRTAGNIERTSAFMAELQEEGCRVRPISCDVSNKKDLAKALRTCEEEKLPPIQGIIQSAMVLRDSILEQMTLTNWKAAILPKVQGTWNLHAHFKDVGTLSFFIMFSSMSGIIGYASQSNYSAGGSYEDALARWRIAQGLPAVSIDLSAIESVGYAAETAGVTARLQKVGHRALSEDQLLRVLESAILNPYEPQVVTGLNTGPGRHWDRDGESQVGRDARFIGLRYCQRQHKETGDQNTRIGTSLGSKLVEATSRDEVERLVGQAIAQKLADIFQIPVNDISPSKPLSQYGVDSLVAVELRNMLAQQAAAQISIFGIMQSASLAGLTRDVAATSGHVNQSLLIA